MSRYITNTINGSDIKLSPVCFPFSSEQNKVSLPFIDGIFVTHNIPEGNSKIARGQTGSMALIDIGRCKEAV